MIKKVGLLLLVFWGLTFSTTLHAIGTLVRVIHNGFQLVFRTVTSVINYRPLRPATGFIIILLSFTGMGAA